jgi:serine protease
MSRHSSRQAIRSPLLAAAVALAFALPVAAAPGRNARPDLTDQLIVRFKAGTTERGNSAARQRVLDGIGHRQGLHLGQLRRGALDFDVIRIDRQLDKVQLKALIGELRRDPRVEIAEPDRWVYPAFTPNDPMYAQQWHYFEATGGANLPLAWDQTTGTGQKVAVLDTGIVNHTDLSGNIVGGYDFITSTTTANDGGGRDSDPSDPGDAVIANECYSGSSASDSSWHGTHVAGTIAALTNNGVGVAGVAFGAKVVPIRVLGKCGGTTSDINDAIVWASGGTVSGVPANANPAKAINMSLGGGGSCLASTQTAIDTANANGTVVIVAAGNDNSDASGFQPASCLNVITVGAVGRGGGRASYSNYGTAVDLAAPGGDSPDFVLSTLNAGATAPGAENYEGYQGTSMATPHVAGVAALAQAKASGALTPAQMESLLKLTTRSRPVPCPLGCGTGILDANAAVTAAGTTMLTITDPTDVEEGDSGTHTVTFTVNLTKASAGAVTFDIATANGTATAGSDYVAKTSTAQSIPAGQTSKTFVVTVNGDTTGEFDETFFANVTNVSGATALDTQGQAYIVSDEPPELLNGVAWTGLSGALNTLTTWVMNVPVGATNLSFTLSGGTGDADMYVRQGSPPDLSTFDCRPFLTGNNETCGPYASPTTGAWYVSLHGYEAYSGVSLVGSYTVPVAVSVNDVSTAEGNSGTKVVTFTVSLDQASGSPVTFDFATANGSASSASDYVASSLLSQSIPAGQLTKTFNVTVNGDTTAEANEQFFVNLTNVSGASVTDAQGKATIVNDDGANLRVSDVSIAEGNAGTSLMTFTVSTPVAAAGTITYTLTSSNGTASAGSDYTAVTYSAQTISAGQLSRTHTVTINGDTSSEQNETLKMTLSSVSGATVYDSQGIGTILNDEGPTLSINDLSVAEGNSGTKNVTFTITLSQNPASTVTVTAATANGNAAAPTDYSTRAPAVQTFSPGGALTKAFNVTVRGDTTVEKNEYFYVNLTSPTNATIFDSQGKANLINDDGPNLRIADVSTTEGNSGTKTLTFTVSTPTASGSNITYTVATSNGTATAGSDYVAKTTNETLTAGMLSKTFAVTINGDTAVEANETFKATISNAVGASVYDSQATGTITNDD